MAQEDDLIIFKKMIDENRYDFCKLVYIIFPFGQKGHALEHKAPYDWQMEEWAKLSKHLSNPATRYETYQLAVSSGNGAAKTAFGAMTFMMLMYTQRVRARITANTDPQMTSTVWPEYDIWFNHCRYVDVFFEKFGKSIKAKNPKDAETWRLDSVTWDEQRPASISGLHNKGGVAMYIFEEAPGIPAVIFKYASGAFTETDTIKLFFAFGNSDDPESKFEQNMKSPHWHTRRIDTRTLKHIDPKQVRVWLEEAGGNEDHDDFRVRVRGLPRKTAKDSIISIENVQVALLRAKTFDLDSVAMLPCILTCDPAWTGGDETAIAMRQGPYSCLLEKYKLDKSKGDTHMMTFNRLQYWENEIKADAVFIDQGEGTGIFTLAINAGKTSWELISFANTPNDTPEFKDSQYANLRAQMYYQYNEFLMKGGVLDVHESVDQQTRDEWIDMMTKQLCWTKGGRHKINGKKLAESKVDIKNRVGQSPDVADVLVMTQARNVMDRLPENEMGGDQSDRFQIGQSPYHMPEHDNPLDSDAMEVDYRRLYD